MALLWLILLLTALFFAGTLIVYLFALFSPNTKQNDDRALAKTAQMAARRTQILELIDAARAIPYETISILAPDGTVLRGRYLHQRDGAPICLCFHGYRGTPYRDFCGGLQIMRRLGMNVLLAEQRAHCRSEGSTITFGVKERLDCMAWTQYVRYRFGADSQVLLVGISMGASTVLMASNASLPDCVRGVIADCPYTTPKDIIISVAEQMHFFPHLSFWLVNLAARIYAGVSLRDPEADAIRAVQHTRLPVLLIHGESDYFVPCYMSEQIRNAAREKVELHLFPRAGHGMSFLLDPERYERLYRDFVVRILGEDTIAETEQTV